MRTEAIQIFKFDELPDRAKEVARDWYRSISDTDLVNQISDSDYFTELYREAGYTFTRAYWSIDRDWHYSPENLQCENTELALKAANCLNRFGLVDEFLLLTKQYGRRGSYRWEHRYHGSKVRIESHLQITCDALNESLSTLEHEALKTIRAESEYLDSTEYIDEQITCNEYEFTANGDRY